MGNIYEHKGYEIRKHRPRKRVSWRIYKNNGFLHSATLLKDAKSQIDFMIKCGVWK